MSDPVLFSVRNKQSAACGEPPSIDGNTPHRYHAYFENAQGEQLIFVYDRETNTGTLYHGDLGWERPQPVVDGICPTVVLDEAEIALAARLLDGGDSSSGNERATGEWLSVSSASSCRCILSTHLARTRLIASVLGKQVPCPSLRWAAHPPSRPDQTLDHKPARVAAPASPSSTSSTWTSTWNNQHGPCPQLKLAQMQTDTKNRPQSQPPPPGAHSIAFRIHPWTSPPSRQRTVSPAHHLDDLYT